MRSMGRFEGIDIDTSRRKEKGRRPDFEYLQHGDFPKGVGAHR